MLPVFSVDVAAPHPGRTFTVQSDIMLPAFRNKEWQKSSSLMLVAENMRNADANAFVIDHVPTLVARHAQGNISVQSVMQNVVEELCNSWEGDPREIMFVSAVINHASQQVVIAHVGAEHVAAVYSNAGKLAFHTDTHHEVSGVQRRDVHPHACLYSFGWSELKGDVLLLGSHLAAWKAVDVTVQVEAHSSATEFVQSLQTPVTAVVTRFHPTQASVTTSGAKKSRAATASKKALKTHPTSGTVETPTAPLSAPTQTPSTTKPILKKPSTVSSSTAPETKRSVTKKRRSSTSKSTGVGSSSVSPSPAPTVVASSNQLTMFREVGKITSKYAPEHILKRANVVEMGKPIANNAAFGNSVIQSAILQKENDGIVLAFRFTDGTDGSTSELVSTQRLSNGDLLLETASGSLYHVTQNVQCEWETS